MDRETIERRIFDHALEIRRLIEEYGAPSGKLSLSISMNDDDYIAFWNEYYEADKETPIDFYYFGKLENNND